jgi:hypothetical protein
MQRWEYCQVYTITVDKRGADGVWARAVFSREDKPLVVGLMVEEDEENVLHSWARYLAKLGAEGWELVSAGGQVTGSAEFYFKRPEASSPRGMDSLRGGASSAS